MCKADQCDGDTGRTKVHYKFYYSQQMDVSPLPRLHNLRHSYRSVQFHGTCSMGNLKTAMDSSHLAAGDSIAMRFRFVSQSFVNTDSQRLAGGSEVLSFDVP